MNKYVAAFLAAAFVMIALDMLWLGVIAKAMYQQAIGHLMAAQPNRPVALAFYTLYAIGLVIFAIAPQSGDPNWSETTLMGALFGFFAYATYDLSNFATLRDWPIRLTLIDMIWGTSLSAVSAWVGRIAMTLVASTD